MASLICFADRTSHTQSSSDNVSMAEEPCSPDLLAVVVGEDYVSGLMGCDESGLEKFVGLVDEIAF